MYNQTSIDTLIARIGWAEAVPPSTITVSSENQESTSGRYFNMFNQLATVENVQASIANQNATNDTLNDMLATLRKDGVMDVLNKVYNLNLWANVDVYNQVITSLNYSTDYSNSIIINAQTFDDAIGLIVAIKALEMLLVTNRSNRNTNNPKVNEAEIINFLHGAATEKGQILTKGLYAQYRETIGKIITVLFPLEYPPGTEITTGSGGGVSVKTKGPATLRGRSDLW